MRVFTQDDDAARGVQSLVQVRAPRAGSSLVVAVDGPSGAGKSSFATLLATQLSAAVVRLDDVYPGWDGLEDGVSRVVDGLLSRLDRGEPGRLRRYDWVQGRDGQEYDVPAAAVIVLDGCGAGSTLCAPYLSVIVWVDAPEADRYRRAMARDGEGFRPHWARWAAQERAHFGREGTRDRADLRLDTADTARRAKRNTA